MAESFGAALDAEVARLTRVFGDYAKDGFDTKEIFRFVVECLLALTTVAKGYDAIPDQRKLRAIIQAAKRIYLSRNPDMPWIPEPFETMIEGLLWDTLAPVLYEALSKKSAA